MNNDLFIYLQIQNQNFANLLSFKKKYDFVIEKLITRINVQCKNIATQMKIHLE